MSCAETRKMIDAYVDDELDLRGALEIEEHLAGCAECAAEERALRELRASARANLARYEPPPELQARLRKALQGPTRTRAGWRAWKWAPLAPLAAAAALLLMPRLRTAEPPVADAVVAAHVRSLLANHLTDVASSDQHTVKPWFQGKLDYSVSVTDWAAEGFPLAGGRLEYVEDTLAAALVYRRAQHVVNLFVWPIRRAGGGASDEPVQHVSRRGYSAYCWTRDGMRYWAVSDVNDADLQKFVELVRGRG